MPNWIPASRTCCASPVIPPGNRAVFSSPQSPRNCPQSLSGVGSPNQPASSTQISKPSGFATSALARKTSAVMPRSS